ncbi:MAG: hypothetical protein JWO58_2542 [Chitinophagaceae bacterium]|nr:hypothetical protein [Chitinophagaceae bacterium]
MNIIKKQKDIAFHIYGSEDCIYSIRRSELPLIMGSKERGISVWIHQLHDKTWIEPDDFIKTC